MPPAPALAPKPFSPLTAGLVLASAATASAQVVHTLHDTTVLRDQLGDVDVSHDGVADLNFSLVDNGFTSETGDLKPQVAVPEGQNTTFVTTAYENDLIGPVDSGGTEPEGTFSFWPGETGSALLGFSFVTGESDKRYGWGRLSWNQDSITFVESAYEASGQGIYAGTLSAIPEPAATTAMAGAAALLAGSAAAWRRRKQRLPTA